MDEELVIRLMWLNVARQIEEKAWASLGVEWVPKGLLVWRRTACKLGQTLSKERSN